MLPVTRHIAIVAILLVALPLLLACGEAEDLGPRAGSAGDPTAATSTSEAETPTSDTTGDFTPTAGIAGLPVVTAEPGMLNPRTPAFEESEQATDEPEWLTLDEAQARVDFDIVVPAVIPEGLHLIGIGVDTLFDPQRNEGEGPLVAYLGFSSDPEEELPAYALAESLEPPIEFDDLAGLAHHQQELDFGSTVVTKTWYAVGCYEFIALNWSEKNVHFAVVSSAPGSTDVALAARLAGAVIGVEPPADVFLTTPEPVEPAPNPGGDYCDLTPQDARELAPFPVHVPDETPPPFVLEQIDLLTQRWGESDGYSPDGTVVIESTPEMREPIELMMRYTVDGASFDSSVTVSQRSTTSGMDEGSIGGPDGELIVIDGVDVHAYTFPDPQYAPESSDAATAEAAEASDWPVTTTYAWVFGETEFTMHVIVAPDDDGVVTDQVVLNLITSFIRVAANP